MFRYDLILVMYFSPLFLSSSAIKGIFNSVDLHSSGSFLDIPSEYRRSNVGKHHVEDQGKSVVGPRSNPVGNRDKQGKKESLLQ